MTNLTEEIKRIKKIDEYLKGYGWTRVNIAMALDNFQKTHGKKAIRAIDRFIEWAEQNGEKDLIAPTLGHDLNGCQDKFMCPRTSRY